MLIKLDLCNACNGTDLVSACLYLTYCFTKSNVSSEESLSTLWRRCFHPPNWYAAVRHSPSDVLIASLTPFCVMSVLPSGNQQLTQRAEKACRVSHVHSWPLEGLQADMQIWNSTIQQYSIHLFFQSVNWAQVWRTSHARVRQLQRDAWSCHRANPELRGCSTAIVTHHLGSLNNFPWLSLLSKASPYAALET